jgi:hypothetical protein
LQESEELMEIKNAIITSVRFDTERGLSAWLVLDYGGAGQGFGGYLLYAPKGWAAHNDGGNFAGHFVYRCLEIAGANDWADLVGKTIRVRADMGGVHSIGHIVRNDWFDPAAEFEELKASVTK